MMESSNLNLDLHHQDHDLHVASSLPWSHQDLILSGSGHDHHHHQPQMPMVHDLGFQWCPAEMSMSMSMKEELYESFTKLAGVNLQDYYAALQMPSQELHQLTAEMNQGGSGSFSMVLPTANVSGSGLYPAGSMGFDLQALDLLASARFGRTMSHPSLDTMALLRDDLGYGPLAQLRGASEALPTHPAVYHKASSVSGVTESKRTCGTSYASHPAAPPAKKPRLEPRASFTPIKVRKEKLGDRIAALQQLVAPFGKTDTASVLMEAIGYIKFLQDQVETLSVPYMRPSNNKNPRTSQRASNEERLDEPKPDLRSRGLCLVPLSCTSYVTNENGGVWSPPNYRGGT